MAYAINILNTDNRGSSSIPLDEDYDSLSGTDSDETAQPQAVSLSRTSATGSPHSFTFPHTLQSGRSSLSSTATNTPLPSRSTSPLPQFYPSTSSSGASDTDSEPFSPFLQSGRNPWWREDRRSRWWTLPRRRRKRDGRVVRFMKKWSRRIARHPCFPQQPITIVRLLLLYSFNLACSSSVGVDSDTAICFRHLFHSATHVYPQPGQGSTTLASLLRLTINDFSVGPHRWFSSTNTRSIWYSSSCVSA